MKLAQTHGHRNQGDAQNADDDRAAHAEVIQRHGQEKAEHRQQHRPVRRFGAVGFHIEIGHFQQSGVAADNHAGVFQRNQRQKQADAGGNRHFQTHRQRVYQQLAHLEKAEQNKNHARYKHRRQRNLPGNAFHAHHHRKGEIGVQPHAWRQRDRVVGQKPHNQAADGRRNAGGNKHRAEVHAGFGQGERVDDDDVAHGEKGGETGQNLGADGSFVLRQAKKALEQGGGVGHGFEMVCWKNAIIAFTSDYKGLHFSRA